MPPRLLVACLRCRRQFSVAERMVGKRIHCHCGEAVEVRAARGHDAAVVACSSCGAPRQDESTACCHCDSDFTLHERDLDTVCPGCLARISRRGRFCHHCGLRIAVEPVRKRNSTYACSACEEKPLLAHRTLGERQVAVLECQTCAGLWIPIERFAALVDQEAMRQRSPRGPKRPAWKEQSGRLYRPCVVCRKLMIRQHFGRGKSGVIVDICASHGVWFDNEELSHILAWVRAGNVQDARLDLAKLKYSQDRALKRRAHTLDECPSPFAGEQQEHALSWADQRRAAHTVDRMLRWLFA